MKQNYKQILVLIMAFMIGIIGYSQNIQISIANAQNTNDGANDYYEADITIQTIDGQADFKLGSGQLYFNYNTAAFGDDVDANNRFEVTADYGSGYFLGEMAGFTNFYDITTINDNTTSRVSWAFSQGVSSGAMTEIVGSTPKLMVHVKFTYVNVSELPMVEFETNEAIVSNVLDQFYTACGPFDSAATTLDCTADVDPQNVNNQFENATLDSSGATLSAINSDLVQVLSVYPNPANETMYVNINRKSQYSMIDLFGKIVKTGKVEPGENELDLKNYQAGIYFLKIKNDSGSVIKKVIKE